jgi:hypothetical protein
MPQLNFYVSEETAQKVRELAAREGKPVSRYLAELISQRVSPGWPTGFFQEVIGSWKGPLEEPEDAPPQVREGL